jgi:TonB family protein
LPRKSLTAALPIAESRLKSNIRVHTPGNPGGKLNVGTPSPGGDLPGNWSGGSTPVGWVSGNNQGSGKGSGSGIGVGAPDPPKQADQGPGTRPAPAPTPTPTPIKITVRICSVSGLRAGEHCKDTRNESFLEGHAPSRTCDLCKEPEHNSRLADRANPELLRDSRPTIPSSVPEGLSLTVVIEYTVAADGDVEDIKITRSSGYKALDRAVADSASRLKYKPAIQDGVPRSVRKTRTYTINT